jgi:hypothetical protein
VIEHPIVKLDEQPWHAIVRIAIGFAVIPAWQLVFGAQPRGWTLIAWFLVVLVGLRAGPLIIRRALPVSADTRVIWASRRETGRKYDSYQWQKLFWIGLGLAAHALAAGERSTPVLALTAVCLIGGAGGVAVWSRRAAARA